MVKALLKKEFLSFYYSLFQNKKTGKARKKAAVSGLAVLLVISYISISFLFFGMASQMIPSLKDSDIEYVPFAFMGVMAFIVSIFVTGFYAGSALYGAKDNELLLSMPIPPLKILLTRMIAIYLSSLLTVALVLLPTVIAWCVFGRFTALSLVFSLINIFIFSLFTTVCSCVLGFVISYITSKVRRKSVATAVLTVAFLVVYYIFYFNMQNIISSVVLYGYDVANKIKTFGFIFYMFAKGSMGEWGYMLGFFAVCFALFAVLCAVLAKTFLKVATGAKSGVEKRRKEREEYSEAQNKTSSVKSALLRREFRRFVSSAAYLTNVGLGVFLMVAGTVCLLIFKGKITTALDNLNAAVNLNASIPAKYAAIIPDMIRAAFAALICMISSTVYFTAASISTEGKQFWILRSSPVSAVDLFDAKIRAHILLCGIPAVALSGVASFVLKTDLTGALWQMLLCFGFVEFSAVAGLWLNLKMPNLDWTNEAVPVKQGAPVLIAFFGGWVLSALIAVFAYLLHGVISTDHYMLILALVFLFSARLINSYLNKNGERLLLGL